MRIKVVRAVITWLNRRYPYLCMDIILGPGKHIHANPKKKKVKA